MVYFDGHQVEVVEIVAKAASQEYEEDFISLVEMIYGKGLLSQGGVDSIDEMFEGINLEGLKLLDLGFGLGMYDIYLAKHHNVEIIGLDPQEALVQKALTNLEEYKNDLRGTISFRLMKDPYALSDFPDNSFDIVFSKESMLHVPYEMKEGYFREIYRVLKDEGTVIIMDWAHKGLPYTDHTKKMMEMDGLVFQLLTPLEYQNLLNNAGFSDLELIDTTSHHTQLSKQNIVTIVSLEKEIKAQFGEDAYNYSLESWTYQYEAFKTRELFTHIFRANKNMSNY